MTEQEMRDAFFGATRRIATSSPNTYRAFCAGVMLEREACAKACEAEGEKWEGDGIPEPMSRICAYVIRTRSNA